MFEYIDAIEISNSVTVEVADIEGFLKLASSNHIRHIFAIHPKENQIGKENLFFFPLNSIIFRLKGKNYKSLEDFQEAKLNGFDSSIDYYEANTLGFKTFEEYNHCKSLGIDKKDEFEEAKRTGFVKGFDKFVENRKNYNIFNHLKDLPEKFHNPVELYKYALTKYFNNYKDFETALSNGYPDYKIWKDAESKGFKLADDFYVAVSEGFYDAKEYVEGKHLLISSKKEYDQYNYFKLYSEGLYYDERLLLDIIKVLPNDTKHTFKELREKLDLEKESYKRTIANNTERILPAWFKRGIESDDNMKKFLKENKLVRRIGFYDDKKDIFEIFKLSRNKIYVDASNVAYYSSNDNVKIAEFKNVKLVVFALKRYLFNDITVIADASLKHKAKDINILNELKKIVNYHEVPFLTSADDFLIQSAKTEKCLIVSNDGFSDWKKKDRWIANNIDDIRQPFMITNEKVMFAGLEKLLKELR